MAVQRETDRLDFICAKQATQSHDAPLCLCFQHHHEKFSDLQSLLSSMLAGNGDKTGPQLPQGQVLTLVTQQLLQDGVTCVKSGEK